MSIIDQARAELAASHFGDEDSRVMIEILEKFFSQWNSGGSVFHAASVLQRLLAGKPLSALTGEDDEWFVHNYDDDVYAQNRRCSTVFKRRDGSAYDIALGVRVPVTFPYWPADPEIPEPVVEIARRSKD